MNFSSHFFPTLPGQQTRAAQYLEARRQRDIAALERLIDAAQDYKTRLRFKQTSDFEELQLMNAIIDLIDDGNALQRREDIMDENRWTEDGNPARDDEPYTGAGLKVGPRTLGAAK
jgi:hypothetical protein